MHQVIHNTNDRRTEYSYSCLQPARGPPFWSNDVFWANKICVFSVLVTEKKLKDYYIIFNIWYSNFVIFQNLFMRYQGHWIWIHKCFCSILYFVITVTSNTFIPSLTLSASIHARSSRLGNYTAEFMLQYNFLCRWNRRMNVKTFLDPIQTAWKFIAKHFSIVGKNECTDHDQRNFKFKVKIL